ncbi:MAG: SRPBCC family protein [Pseudomonadota bacterium]
MMHTAEARTLSICIRRSPTVVYEFMANPYSLPLWASGLGSSICAGASADEGWIAETGQGSITIHFSPINDFGVLDHVVTLTSGVSLFVPMRVLINGNGSEVLLTLFRQQNMSDARFEADAEWVVRDLKALKLLLESDTTSPQPA